MEKEKKEEKAIRRFGRRVHLFRKRKKPIIRTTVKIHSQRNYSKLVTNFILILLFLLIIIVTLYIVRKILLPTLVSTDEVLLTPQGILLPDDNQLKNIIQNSGLEIDTIVFASDSSSLTFNLERRTFVVLSVKKDIRGQMDLVEAIVTQLQQDGKQAIYIDLRYNKPIVKF